MQIRTEAITHFQIFRELKIDSKDIFKSITGSEDTREDPSKSGATYLGCFGSFQVANFAALLGDFLV